jgi:flavin-binding protein dodecin
MSKVIKVIEVLAQSEKSWEDAAAKAVKAASKSIDNIRSIYIVDTSAKVENGRIVKYRINAKISFSIGKSKKK